MSRKSAPRRPLAHDPNVDRATSLDARIAVCKLFNLTHIQTAEVLDVSEATVSRHLQVGKGGNGEWIDDLIKWAQPIRRRSNLSGEDVKQLTASDLRKEMELGVGHSWAIVKAAILEGNAELALWHIEQVIGKASQPHKVSGEITHAHVWHPQRVLVQQEHDLMDSDKLLRALPATALTSQVQTQSDITESELVE